MEISGPPRSKTASQSKNSTTTPGRKETSTQQLQEQEEGSPYRFRRGTQHSESSKKTLRIIYSNVQSLFSKVNELSCRIPDFSPDLIILTETWLNKDINNSIINLPGYSIESRTDRTDTTGGRGGGIIVYVKEGLNILVSDHDDSDFNQYCSFSITTNDDVFNFICFYRSPNSSTINNNLLSEVIRNAKSNIFIIGDLNYPNIDWETSIGDKKSETFYKQ